MRKLMIAAIAAAGLAVAAAPTTASASEITGPCATVAELFATANIQAEPLPGPAGYVVGTAVRTVCGVTG